MSEPVNYGTAILPEELDFVKEVVKPGDTIYVPCSAYDTKIENITYRKAKIGKKFPYIVMTSLGPKTYTDLVLGYRYEVKRSRP